MIADKIEISFKNARRVKPPLNYGASSFHMAFIRDKEDQDGNLVRISNGYVCKDRPLDAIKGSIYKLKATGYDPNDGKIHKGLLRMAFYDQNIDTIGFLKGMEGFVQAARCMEEAAGWVGESNAEIVKIETRSKPIIGIYIESPENWKRYPQLLSIYLTTARIISRTGIPMLVTSLEKLIIYLQYVVKAEESTLEKKGLSMARSTDLGYLKTIIPYLAPIICHEKEIFPGDIRRGYPRSMEHASGGIVNFCIGKTDSHGKLAKRFLAKVRK